ncbi:hypothetical protein [uncultured Paraglaciecola sp.]|uniref:hypothetical protein n=1 Tax=uncultured Paraglaciecola sp. TaxID=1765024 RepID=UPI00259565C7|nr:hypothetical protein [uncultured Paraglaciecola sp.]
MANVFGAPRKKVRENEVCRLYLDKQLRSSEKSRTHYRDWLCNDSLFYRQYYKLYDNRIFLYDGKPDNLGNDKGYFIHFNYLKLTYGFRPQFTCPCCSQPVRILYLTKSLFVCRSCSGVTYDSTHSEEVNSLIRMIDRQRIKTHGKEQLELYQPNYLEYTAWIPKPKWKKRTKHQEDNIRLETLERRLETICEQRFGG